MKISIITPSYNQAPFIERTILSVLNQNYPDLEYIVMDGGSTDGTVEILKKYSDRILWKSEKDNGQSDAINKGIKIATGDIIAYLNSDDTYGPDALAAIAQFFKKNPTQKWAYGKCRIIDAKDREIRKPITFYKNFLLKKYSYAKLLSENFISQPATFWKREIHEEIGYFNESEHYCMDYEFWLRIGQKYPAGIIDAYLANFRYYPNSKSGEVNKKQFQDELRLAIKFGAKYPLATLLHRFNYYKITFLYRLLRVFSHDKFLPSIAINSLRKARYFVRIILGRELLVSPELTIQREFIGSSQYGGWFISPENISNKSIIYSFGIGEDISFDLDIIEKYRCKVFAFDPTPKSIQWLKKQVLPPEFSYEEIGLADFDGKINLFPPENDNHISHSIIQKNTSGKSSIEVAVRRLETIAKKFKHNNISILKMDIEGAEYAAIRDILKSNLNIQQILIEFHHRFREIGINETKQAIELLRKHGYQIFSISTSREEYSFIKK
jgi:FkbM family methyltransferase